MAQRRTRSRDPEILQLGARLATHPDDAHVHYRLAVLMEESRGLYGVPDATADRKLLSRIRRHLIRVIQLEPQHARAHAQLGYTCDQLGELESALGCFIKARALDPKRESVDVYVATMLVSLQREEDALKEIEALARRRRVNLRKLRDELARAEFPEDAKHLLMNGFVHARNVFASEIASEAPPIRESLTPGQRRRDAKVGKADCAARQKELKKAFKSVNVPKELRPLAAAASRYGIGDDVCRPAIMKRIPRARRAKLFKAAGKLAKSVQKWLDGFGGGDKMSVEAAAYMYLYEGLEEIR